MHPDALKLLEDIRDAGSFVLDVVRDCGQEAYEQNRLARQAVERNFEIIGEALGRLSKADPDTAQRVGPVPQIVAFRNILVHAYDNIAPRRHWKSLTKQTPLATGAALV